MASEHVQLGLLAVAATLVARRTPAVAGVMQLQKLLLLAFFGLLQARVGARSKLVLELLDTACRINELQFAGVKRMAGAANIEL